MPKMSCGQTDPDAMILTRPLICSPAEPAGQVLEMRLLGSTATYVVVERDGEFVEVEVVDAPGLTRGQRFRFAANAVAAMRPARRP